MKKSQVFIVDDHKLFRKGLRLILEETALFYDIQEAGNGQEFLEKLKDFQPDLVLMDIRMPEMDGIEATRLACLRQPQIKIAALSMFDDKIYYEQMVNAGAIGFLVKDSNVQELEVALQKILQGESYIAPQIREKLLHDSEEMAITDIKLTKREQEVLQLIAEGLSNQEIADKLYLSPRTVERHRANLLYKTGAKNSISLILFAVRHKIVTL